MKLARTLTRDRNKSSAQARLTGNEALDDLVAARPISILGVPLLIGLMASLIFPSSNLPAPLSQGVGMALIGLGILLGYWAVRSLESGGASPDAFLPPAALVTEGPFRFSRNPIYLGFVMIYAGLGALLNSLWIVLLTPVVVIGLTQAIIVPDERLLDSRFGDEFNTYRERVRRWL